MLYVDKTDLIFKIAKQRSPIFFSRPRRFGKSLLVNTLSCLFSKGIEYFHGLAIENMWHDTTYRVVHLDFSGIASAVHDKFMMAFAETLITEFDTNNSVSAVNDF